jgi:hypothetical protein
MYMVNLDCIILSENFIKIMPKEISALKKLTGFEIDGNILTEKSLNIVNYFYIHGTFPRQHKFFTN